MYCSDPPRAVQTVGEMNRPLHCTPVYSELIREVNAVEGSGKVTAYYIDQRVFRIRHGIISADNSSKTAQIRIKSA